MAYDDDQELKETKEDVQHSDVMLGEIENKEDLVNDDGQEQK